MHLLGGNLPIREVQTHVARGQLYFIALGVLCGREEAELVCTLFGGLFLKGLGPSEILEDRGSMGGQKQSSQVSVQIKR